MNTYKIIVEYKGSNYQGFQSQPSGQTIQDCLNSALKLLSKSTEVKSLGSGRTDAGVHALGQVVRIEIPVSLPLNGLVKAMNSHLPSDIRVKSADHANENFHPIYSAQSKEYNYVFTNTEHLSPFASELMTHIPFEMDFDLLKKGTKLFIGEHDFINYQCTGTDVASTVRKITHCELLHFKSSGHWEHLAPEYYVLRIVGNGFLKQMVRLIMGALWALARNKIELKDIEKSLKEPLTNRLGATAPPEGLYLKEVHY